MAKSKPVDNAAPMLFDPMQFVEYYVKRHALTILPTGKFEQGRRDEIVRQMWLAYLVLATPRRFSKSDLSDAVQEFCTRAKQAALEQFRNTIKCDTENLSPLKAWLKATTGNTNEVDVAVWAHALCNLKRKMFNLESYWEMMPVLVGKQGSGKSRAIQRLLSPIDALTLHYDVEQAVDAKVQVNYNTHYAAFLDELSKGSKTDIAAVKRLITQPQFNTRLMRENDTDNFKQNCTFFGASNYSVSDTFKDETGARRFYDTKGLDRTDRNVINSLDYVELFRGIDERRTVDNSYLVPIETKLAMRQEALVAEDPVQAFVEHVGWTPGSEVTGEFVSMVDIIDRHFNPYAEKTNIRKYDTIYLGIRLARIGFEPARDTKTGARGRYVIKRESALSPLSKAGMKVLK